jgi:3-methyladenine DNA glycosylase AlkD
MNLDDAIEALRSAADPSRKPGMARVGIRVDRALGVSVPDIRRIARRAGTDHRLAMRLWNTRIHEARMLATLVADPAGMSDAEMERWVAQIDSWDVGDAAADLFTATWLRDRKIRAWAAREEPFVKRCAFAMIARRAVSDLEASDAAFTRLFPLIRRAARDDRNEVMKGVSWALRQIGKRDHALNAAAIEQAERILEDGIATGSRGARWVGRDVLRELRAGSTLARLRNQRGGPEGEARAASPSDHPP